MKRSLWVIALTMVLALSFFSVSSAEENGIFSVENFSSTIIFTSDYIDDGVSVSDQDPAIQGTIDYTHPGSGVFLGLWGSSWDDGGYSNDIELGVWGGQAGSIGPLDYDITLYYWFYPGAEDDDFEFDYFQAGINLGHTFEKVMLEPTLTVGYLWSPDYFGEEGTYQKFVAELNLSLVYGITLMFEAAHVDVEGGAFTGNGNGMNGGDGYDWEYYRIGLSKDLIAGINIDLSYYYNSEKEFFETYYGGKDVADPRLVFTLSRTF
jgi:uncharacterized protein (TIGR02001 family)